MKKWNKDLVISINVGRHTPAIAKRKRPKLTLEERNKRMNERFPGILRMLEDSANGFAMPKEYRNKLGSSLYDWGKANGINLRIRELANYPDYVYVDQKLE